MWCHSHTHLQGPQGESLAFVQPARGKANPRPSTFTVKITVKVVSWRLSSCVFKLGAPSIQGCTQAKFVFEQVCHQLQSAINSSVHSSKCTFKCTFK